MCLVFGEKFQIKGKNSLKNAKIKSLYSRK